MSRSSSMAVKLMLLLALCAVALPSQAVFAEDEKGGAATPKEAAEKFIAALKAKDIKAVMALMPPEAAASEGMCKCILDNLTIKEAAVGEETVQESSAQVAVKWTAELNVEKFVAAMIESVLAEYKKNGVALPAEQLAEMKKSMEEGFAHMGKGYNEAEQSVMVMKQGERWYVIAMAPAGSSSGPGPSVTTDRTGADKPEAAVEGTLAAAQKRDIKGVMAMAHPFSPISEDEVAVIFEGLTIAEYKVGEAKVQGGLAFVSYTMKATFDPAKPIEHALAERLKQAKENGEEVTDETIAEYKKYFTEMYTHLKAMLEDSDDCAVARQDNGKWFVMSMHGGDAAQAAIKTTDEFLSALKAKDASKVKAFMPAPGDEEHSYLFSVLELNSTLAALDVAEWNAVSVMTDEGSGSVEMTIKFAFKDAEKVAAAALEARKADYKKMGQEMDEESIKGYQESIKCTIDALTKCSGKDAHFYIYVSKIEDKWYISLSPPNE